MNKQPLMLKRRVCGIVNLHVDRVWVKGQGETRLCAEDQILGHNEEEATD